MAQRMNVGVIGATGMVGQNYLRLLANHPWFEVSYVAASPQSAGKTYAEAVAGRWHMCSDIPDPVQRLVVGDASDVQAAKGKCDLIFSAVSLDKKAVLALELAYAAAGFPVVTNNSAHRATPDVPMVIPEINPGHLDVIAATAQGPRLDHGLYRRQIQLQHPELHDSPSGRCGRRASSRARW